MATSRSSLQWVLGVAVSLIGLLLTLGANAQLRRLDQLEARVLVVEREIARVSAQLAALEASQR